MEWTTWNLGFHYSEGHGYFSSSWLAQGKERNQIYIYIDIYIDTLRHRSSFVVVSLSLRISIFTYLCNRFLSELLVSKSDEIEVIKRCSEYTRKCVKKGNIISSLCPLEPVFPSWRTELLTFMSIRKFLSIYQFAAGKSRSIYLWSYWLLPIQCYHSGRGN